MISFFARPDKRFSDICASSTLNTSLGTNNQLRITICYNMFLENSKHTLWYSYMTKNLQSSHKTANNNENNNTNT